MVAIFCSGMRGLAEMRRTIWIRGLGYRHIGAGTPLSITAAADETRLHLPAITQR